MTTRSHAVLALALGAIFASATAAQAPLSTWTGAHNFDNWGSVVLVVGDLNGDQIRDVAVSSASADHTVPFPFSTTYSNVGVVRIHSGADGAVLRTWIGDLSGGTLFGYALADAGDVNGDGFDDVLIGAPTADGLQPDSGSVQLRSGLTGAVLRTFFGTQTGSRFGHALAAGDVDGDGVFDVAVGAPGYNADGPVGGTLQEGRVSQYRCSNGALISTFTGYTYSGFSGEQYVMKGWGTSLAYAGDSNADGVGEFVAGAPNSTYIAPAGGTTTNGGFALHFQRDSASETHFSFHGSQLAELTGSALAVLGDADLDGKLDIAIGSPGFEGGTGTTLGRVRVYSGNGFASYVINGTAQAPVGTSLAAMSDANGDGLPDLLVGSPNADVMGASLMTDAGQAQVHAGNTGALLRVYSGQTAGDHLGAAVAAADLDHVGADELILAAPQADSAGLFNNGAVYLFDGEDCPAPASWSLYGTGLAGTFGVPSLGSGFQPKLGQSFTVFASNSSGQSTLGYLFMGFASQNLSVKGGTLLVNALLIQGFPMPSGGKLFPFVIPADPALCGVNLYAQTLQLDAGAPLGVSFSRGMQITIGD